MYTSPLAYRPVHNQGGALKACQGLVKSDNAESEPACKPRRARPEAHIYSIVPLVKDIAIHCEARFVVARFRPCRGMVYTSEAPLTVYYGQLYLDNLV